MQNYYKNHNSYGVVYGGADYLKMTGRRKLAVAFFNNIDRLGIRYYRESDNPEIEFIKNLYLA